MTPSQPPGPGRIPGLIVAVAALGAALILIPVVGLASRTPWSSLAGLLTEPAATRALRVSLVTATAAAVVATVGGAPLGWVFARSRRRGVDALRALVLLPLVLPPVVAGVALLSTFGRRGLLGGPLDALGVQIPFTAAAVVLAQAFVALPFVVLTVETGVRAADPGLEEAGAACGGSRWFVLRHVSLPLVLPSIVAAAVLAWARALGEFGATITFAGNVDGRTRTLPLAVVTELQSDADAALALSALLVVVSLGVLVGMRNRWLGSR